METGVRIDKWLWAVRLYKTRSQATNACREGQVKIRDHPVKPSHEVKPGEIIAIDFRTYTRTAKVLDLLEKRVSAELALHYVEDLTTKEEYDKNKIMRETGFEYRERGVGRPTKRHRRDIEWLKKYLGA